MTDLVIRTDSDGLATLTLNRPDKLNALNVPLFVELRAHVDAIAAQTDMIGCVVVRGNKKAFSAGHDLKDIGAGERPPYANYQSETIEKLATLPQPVVTAIQGHCYTGALELALAGDIIIASQSARIGDTHAKWALSPAWGGSQRLPRRVGVTKAKEMMLTCRSYSGEEAASFGLANMCVRDDLFDEEVEKLARSILVNSWHSTQGIKKLFDATDGFELRDGLTYEIENGPGRAPDAAERVASFGKK
jgi:enoyl-CoA hydratase/carnithine racemase